MEFAIHQNQVNTILEQVAAGQFGFVNRPRVQTLGQKVFWNCYCDPESWRQYFGTAHYPFAAAGIRFRKENQPLR